MKEKGLIVLNEERMQDEMSVSILGQEWYEFADGYDTVFLGEQHVIPHPIFKQELMKDIAPLQTGGYVLDYTHFSIVMSKSRRLAFYSAVNIDGNQLKNIRREKDNWYYDSRIDRAYQAGPDLYRNNDLDRGHLVRRRDPVWGKRATAANEDTFHFTNCVPQHKDLNQRTWLDLEDYILDNAVNHQLKVSVFTGPVFKETDPWYRGIQIPEEFWKIVVMVKQNNRLSATAYLQTQKDFIGSLEFSYGAYQTYQVAITQIEAVVGLDFGLLRDADPLLGSESSFVIKTGNDIRL